MKKTIAAFALLGLISNLCGCSLAWLTDTSDFAQKPHTLVQNESPAK